MTSIRGTIRFLALCLLITQRSIGDPHPGWKNGRFSGEAGNYNFATNPASRGPVRPSEVFGSFDIPSSGSYGLNQPFNGRAGFKSNVCDSSSSSTEYNAGIGTFNNVPPTQTSNTEGVSYGQTGSDFTLGRLQNETPSSQINNQETASYGNTIMPASTHGTTSFIRSGRYNRPSAVGTGANTVSDGSYFNTGRSDSEFGASDSPNTSTLEKIEEVELTNKLTALTTNQDNELTSRFNSRGLNLNRDTVSGGGRYNPCGPGFHFATQNLRSVSDPSSTTISAQTTVESVPVNSPKLNSLVATDFFSNTVAPNNVVQQPPNTSIETVSSLSSSTISPNTGEIFDTSDVQPIPMTSPVTVSHGATDPSNAIFVHNTNLTPNVQQATIATSNIVSSDHSLPSTATLFHNNPATYTCDTQKSLIMSPEPIPSNTIMPVVQETQITNPGPFNYDLTCPSSANVFLNTAGTFTHNIQQAPTTRSDIVPSTATATLLHNIPATYTCDTQKALIMSPEPIPSNTIMPVVQETQITNPGPFNYDLTCPSSANVFLNTAGTFTHNIQQAPTTSSDIVPSTATATLLHNNPATYTCDTQKALIMSPEPIPFNTIMPVVQETQITNPGPFNYDLTCPSSANVFLNTAGTFTHNIQQAPTTSSDIVPSTATATLLHDTPVTFIPDIQKAMITSPVPISFGTFIPFVQETQNPGTTYPSSANSFLNTAGISTPVVQEPPMSGQVTDYIVATDPSGAFDFHKTGETSKPVVHQNPMNNLGTNYFTLTDPSNTHTFQNTVEMSNPFVQPSTTTSPKAFYVNSSDPSSDTVLHIAETSTPVPQEISMNNPLIFRFLATDPCTGKVIYDTFGTSMSDLVPTEAVFSGTHESTNSLSSYQNAITSDVVSPNPYTSPETDDNDTSDVQISDKSVAPSIPDVEPTAETNSETASLGGNNCTNMLSPHDAADTSDDVVSDPEVDFIKKLDTKTFERIGDIPRSEVSSASIISPEADSVDNPSNGTALTSMALANTSNTNSPENICEYCYALSPKDVLIPFLEKCSSSLPTMTQLKTFVYPPIVSDDYSIFPHISSNSTSPSLRDGSSHPQTPVEIKQSHLMEMMCIETVLVAVGTHCSAVPSGHSCTCTVPQKHHE